MSRPYDHPTGWFTPVTRGFKFACCDCGLVHRIDFRVRDGVVQVNVRARDNRATGQLRRWRRHRCEVPAADEAPLMAR